MEGPWGGWRKIGLGREALLLPVCIASILDARPARQFTNSDAFFAFSAMSALFPQVAMTVLAGRYPFVIFAALQPVVVRSSGAQVGSVLVPFV